MSTSLLDKQAVPPPRGAPRLVGASAFASGAAVATERRIPPAGRLVRDALTVGGGSAVCHVLAAITGLLLRAILEPALVGVWSGLRVFLSYGNFAGLGASKGAAREIPFHTARGQFAAAQNAIDVALTVNTVTSLLYLLALAGAAVWIEATSTGPLAVYWSVGLAAAGVMAVLSRYSTFLVTVLRARQQFSRTTRLALFEAVATLAVTVTATWLWGLYGLLLGTAAVLAASIAWLHLWGAPALQLRWDWSEAKRLMGIGAPILAGGVMLTFLRSLDKVMILAYLPDREFQLGCYSLAVMAGAGLYSVGNVLGIVTYPRYQVRLGRTGSAREVARLAMRVTEAVTVVVTAAAVVAVVAAPAVLARLLPAYRPGLDALLALLPGMLLLAMAIPATHVLITLNKQRQMVALLAAAVAFAAVANHAALTAGKGITGVAAATTASYAFYLVSLMIVAYRGLLSSTELVRFMLRCAVAPLLVTALVAALVSLGGGENAVDWHWSATAICLVAVCGGLVLVIGRTAGTGQLWNED